MTDNDQQLSQSKRAIREREYRKLCPEINRRAVAKYRNSHPEACKTAIYRYQRTSKGRLAGLRNRCKADGVDITLTLSEYEEFLSKPCFYCGGELPETGAGLDRISPSIGYVKGNIRPCCTQCNIAKNDWTETEFREWILRTFSHWANK